MKLLKSAMVFLSKYKFHLGGVSTRFEEYTRRGFINVTNQIFGKERLREKPLWNNFLVNKRAGLTVCIVCWKEYSLDRYAH